MKYHDAYENPPIKNTFPNRVHVCSYATRSCTCM